MVFFVSLQALQGLLRPNELLDTLTEHCTVQLGEEDIWEDVTVFKDKGLRAQKRQKKEKQ